MFCNSCYRKMILLCFVLQDTGQKIINISERNFFEVENKVGTDCVETSEIIRVGYQV